MNEFEAAPAPVADIAQMLVDSINRREKVRRQILQVCEFIVDGLVAISPAAVAYAVSKPADSTDRQQES